MMMLIDFCLAILSMVRYGSVFICPIAIPYSMGQIIKSVCVCLCMYMCMYENLYSP